jgi:hypothetical protein
VDGYLRTLKTGGPGPNTAALDPMEVARRNEEAKARIVRFIYLR